MQPDNSLWPGQLGDIDGDASTVPACPACGRPDSALPEMDPPCPRDGYHITKYYTKTTGSDSKGEKGENWQVTIPASIASQIDAILQGRQIKQYKKRSDVIRDALYHRFHYLKRALNNDQIARQLQQAYANAELANLKFEDEESRAFIRNLREQCQELSQSGSWTILRHTLDLAERHIEVTPIDRREELARLIDAFRKECP